MQRYPAIAQSEGYLDSNAFATSRLPGLRSRITDTILPSIPVDWRDLTGTGAENGALTSLNRSPNWLPQVLRRIGSSLNQEFKP